MPNKTIACSAITTTRNLTQPTDMAEDWAGMDFIIPDLSRPGGGIPIGAFCVCRASLVYFGIHVVTKRIVYEQ